VKFDDGDTAWLDPGQIKGLPPAKIRPHADRPNAAPTPQLTAGTAVQGESRAPTARDVGSAARGSD
jgi:hypothetical protein